MPFIPNNQTQNCTNLEHYPPTMQVFPPSGGMWVCTSCGQETEIPPAPTLKTNH